MTQLRLCNMTLSVANHSLNGCGIWTMNRRCDRKRLLEP